MVGWYDPFCEAIQNALDSIEQRYKLETKNYQPSLWITINLEENYLIVTDNGIGLNEKDFKKFLRPAESIKSKQEGYTGRGHKGVGATYLAYGFNEIQICSKTTTYEMIAKMKDARRWVYDAKSEITIPFVKKDDNGAKDKYFRNLDQGFSIFIKCDKETYPNDLSWIKAIDAQTWLDILLIKTGLGSINKQDNIKVFIQLISNNGENSQSEIQGIEYLWIHKLPFDIKKTELLKIQEYEQKLVKKGKETKNLRNYPSKLKDLDILYEFYEKEKLIQLIEDLEIQDDELKNSLTSICSKYNPFIYCCYAYSENFWDELHKNFGNLRRKYKIFKSGIQLAANNMPQGEICPIDYKSVNADRTFILIHFMGNKLVNQEEMDLIVLKELIDFLNDPEKQQEIQKEKYEG